MEEQQGANNTTSSSSKNTAVGNWHTDYIKLPFFAKAEGTSCEKWGPNLKMALWGYRDEPVDL